MGSNTAVTLTGGVKASNVYWAVAGDITITTITITITTMFVFVWAPTPL
jgi:hypothetical protein